jgi:Tc toxin complex TcA C-terminal TcB-binding domain
MGQNDSGLLELNFRDERRVPFEFEATVSHRRLELPHMCPA